ncbi:MAG: hypothetical protein C4530_14275 [Desulfobacteraceae bacterium]|nr:MAG: hypothetical protein C4530_14275 [Desulfobacteraceae bacterium]
MFFNSFSPQPQASASRGLNQITIVNNDGQPVLFQKRVLDRISSLFLYTRHITGFQRSLLRWEDAGFDSAKEGL